ncbi:MAG: response regulator [Gallionella sp.]|nr:response regulator [Gallionella sp.]
MATISTFSDKWVLVIDDMEGMRSQLRMSLSSSGFAKLHLVSNIKEAIERIAANKYDVILCDYSLGDSTDGQQFLEYLRTNDLITRNTIFVMITAEQAYEKVVVASECAPDDYLLKPFTAAQFNARLEKLLEKQAYFAPLDRATDKKNWARVVAECDLMIPSKDKYFFELHKIKGSALLRNNQPQQAVECYRAILALRPIGWAKLGLARSLAATGEHSESEKITREILAESPQFLAAYDFLAKQLERNGEKNAALDVLQKARQISPGTMSRIRETSALAVDSGQPELAESIMRQALQKHKHSPVRQANDYAVLSKALLNQGKTSEALSTVQEAQKSFQDAKSLVMLAASESVVHRAAGNSAQAEIALSKAMSGTDLGSLPAATVLAVAEACFALGKDAEATKLLQHAVQNHEDDHQISQRVHAVLVASGKDANEASAIISASQQEIILLNNNGVRKAQAGELAEAIDMLSTAADRLPNNLQITGNAALVLALDMVKNGKTADKLARCMNYRETLIKKSPNYPKIEQIDNLLKQLKS